MNQEESFAEKLRHWLARAFSAFQQILPTQPLSELMFHIAHVKAPGFKNTLIRVLMKLYGISLDEAERGKPEDYEDLGDFFTRALKPGARPLDRDANTILSPADGVVSQAGRVLQGRLIQAKGLDYTVAELLGSDELARTFDGGRYCTIYLAPHDYHRVHMPDAGTLKEWTYFAGRLFSVNGPTTRTLPRLFVRNERIAAVFDTPHGPMAVVMVGALFVGSLETAWAGRITPPHHRDGGHYVPFEQTAFARGAEMGRFNFGSTVIVLVGLSRGSWRGDLAPGVPVRMGQSLGTWT